jgi:hypothetical protein
MAKRHTKRRREKKHHPRRRTMKGGLPNGPNGPNEHDEDIYEPIPQNPNDQHFIDMGDMDESFGSMNLDELNTSNMSGNTSQDASQMTGISFDSQDTMNTMDPDELNISNMSGNTTRDNSFGGKKRRRSSKKRRGKGRKTRKYRGGGMCFGNGVGANSYDPNNSIYNTNMLKLFPYKAN